MDRELRPRRAAPQPAPQPAPHDGFQPVRNRRGRRAAAAPAPAAGGPNHRAYRPLKPNNPAAGVYIEFHDKNGFNEALVTRRVHEVLADKPEFPRTMVTAQLPQLMGVATGRNKRDSGWTSTPFADNSGAIQFGTYQDYSVDAPAAAADESTLLLEALRLAPRNPFRIVKITITAVPALAVAGGYSGGNDCLFDALQAAGIDCDAALVREACDIPDGDMIELDDLPEIEQCLNVAIHVNRGLASRVSPYTSRRVCEQIGDSRVYTAANAPVCVTLANNHYSGATLPSHKERGTVAPKTIASMKGPRRLLLVHGEDAADSDFQWTASETRVGRLHAGNLHRIRTAAKLPTDDPKHNNICTWPVRGKHTAESIAREYTAIAALVEAIEAETRVEGQYASHGLWATAGPTGSIATFAHDLWLTTLSKKIPNLNVLEQGVVASAFTGGLVWGGKRPEGMDSVMYDDVEALDVRSLYPYIQRHMPLPDAHPKWADGAEILRISLAAAGGALPIGFYSVTITPEECAKETPFRFRHAKWFASPEVEEMRRLGYAAEIVGPALVWAKSTTVLFGNFTDRWYAAKERDARLKPIVTMAWGKLGQKNRKTYLMKAEEPLPEDFHTLSCDMSAPENISLTGVRLSEPVFKHSCPHLSAFIVAYGRCHINAIMDAVGRERVIAVQTDGVLIDRTMDGPEPVITAGLGGLKSEGRGRCEYVNVNKHRLLNADGTPVLKEGKGKPVSCGRW